MKEKVIGLNYIEDHGWFRYNNSNKKAEIIDYKDFVRKINNNEFNYYLDDCEKMYNTENKIIIITPKQEIKKIYDIPPCGLYSITKNDRFGIGIIEFTFENDKYINLYDEEIKNIKDDIEKFLKNEKQYKELNINHKRGILLYGPPGNGKTMIIKLIIDKYIDSTRIIYIPGGFRINNLIKLKDALSDKKTIFIFEEITSSLTDSSEIVSFLNFLDGINSWNNVLILGTTNYPDKIPGNIIDRPSRFDKIYKFSFPNRNVRKNYISEFMGKDWITEEILDKTKNMSIAYLKELCISCKIYDYDPISLIDEFIKRKKDIKNNFSNEIDEIGLKKTSIGFQNNNEHETDGDEYYD